MALKNLYKAETLFFGLFKSIENAEIFDARGTTFSTPARHLHGGQDQLEDASKAPRATIYELYISSARVHKSC